ncbi:MAG: sugar ABC transporter permease [Ruminococcus sp.]|nr:sugar ABC transporter permease [Ruminococcus sp.]
MKYIDYKQLNPFQKFAYNFTDFFKKLPGRVVGFFKAIGRFFVKLFTGIGKGVANYVTRFIKGDFAVKLSYLIFGFGNIMKGQIIKGLLFLATEVAYIYFIITFGWDNLSKFGTLGTEVTQIVSDGPFKKTIWGHNSMLILLYSVVAIAVTLVFLFIYIANTKSAYKLQQLKAEGKHIMTFKEEIKDFLDGKFHITMLSLPVTLIGVFTIMPLIFMILIAFTNYDRTHMPPGTLFTWVGFDNFADLVNVATGGKKGVTFIELTKWTIVWAVFATFTNYILGMVVALMINKKGIRLKSLWRTLFVITIAVPQFVSLLLMNQMLQVDGAINILLSDIAGQTVEIKFLNDTALLARATVIIINCWVGIPYTILSASGILMNIPVDLYESARIDGAGPIKQFTKITLPYMLFVTAPSLITQFVGNINNFNVIYLLSGGGPSTEELYQAGRTDILVTWLFKLTMNQQDYDLAAAIGILVFIVCATLSLITFNLSKSMKDEEAFS